MESLFSPDLARVASQERNTSADTEKNIKEQIQSWWQEHPGYYRKWLLAHPGYHKTWRLKNLDRRRQYERAYMRLRRKLKKEKVEK